MVQVSRYRRNWPLSALVADDVTFAIAHITTQVIPLIGDSGTIIIIVRNLNMSARQW